MSKKIMCLMLVFVLLLPSVLAGCGNNQQEGKTVIEDSQSKTEEVAANTQAKPEEEKVTLEVWNCDSAPMYTDLFDKMIKNFTDKNPNIQVNYTGIPWDSSKEKFDTAIATNTTPDTAYILHSWVSSFAAADGIIPLDSYYGNWADKSKFDPNMLGLQGLKIDGKTYNAPVEVVPVTVWYRPDWYAEAGVSIPQTFDEFFTNIQKMTDQSKKRFGFTIRGGTGGSQQLEAFLMAYSGDARYFDESGKCLINSPKIVEGFEKFVALYKKYTPESDITNGYKEMSAVFDGGTAATLFHNVTSLPMHRDTLGEGKYASFMLPKADNGKRIICFTGVAATAGYSIFKSSKKPDVAWKFIEHLLSTESDSMWAKELGILPANKDVMKEDWVQQTPSLLVAQSAMEDKDTELAMAPIDLPDYAGIHKNLLEPGLQEVLIGKKTAEAYLTEWAEAFEKAKQEYDKKG